MEIVGDAQGANVATTWVTTGARAGATDEQEPLEFTLQLTPVAPNGELGEAIVVEVSDPGSGSGCAGGGLPGSTGLLLFAAGAWLAVGRRRRPGLLGQRSDGGSGEQAASA